MEIRQIFIKELMELMEENEDIVLLDADLGKANGTMEVYKRYPNRAFELGICEQNMASAAAGMSTYGLIPIISSFTPFVTRRICDQIAVSICYSERNVKILGTDPGIAAQLNGGTHMSVEDIAVLRGIPNIVIYEVADGVQMKQAVSQIMSYDGPVYIRMFRKEMESVYGDGYKFDLFRSDVVCEGSDVTIFSSGIMVARAVEASKVLKSEGISAEVVDVHTIKPLDEETVLKSLRKTNCAVTAENHSVIGGLNGAISELTGRCYPCAIEAVGIKDRFGEVGSLSYLTEIFELSVDDIVEAGKRAYSRKKECVGNLERQ